MEGEEVTPTTQEMIMSDIWIEVMKELHSAETKHPLWPTDVVYGAAIVVEESGELMQAAVQRQMEGGELEACEREAIQTIVTCIRFVKALKMRNVNDGPPSLVDRAVSKLSIQFGSELKEYKDLVDRMYNFLIHYVPVYDKTKNEDPKKYEMSVSIRDDYHKVRFKHFKDSKSNDCDGERIG